MNKDYYEAHKYFLEHKDNKFRYDFGKKTFSIYLYYAKTSISKNNAINAEKT